MNFLPTTFIFELDMVKVQRVQKNQRAKYVGQRWFSSKGNVRECRDTHTGPI